VSVENGDMPAMPVECQFGPDDKVRGQQTGNYSGWEIGLTKRELFAAMAMQGLLATGEYWDDYADRTAAWAVKNADALLAELAKKAGAS
jgi:hypothetical protein